MNHVAQVVRPSRLKELCGEERHVAVALHITFERQDDIFKSAEGIVSINIQLSKFSSTSADLLEERTRVK